jgi:hypothetical protein
VEAAAPRRDRPAEAISRRFIIPEGLLNRPERGAGENLQYEIASVLCFHGSLFDLGEEIQLRSAAFLDAAGSKVTAQRIFCHVHNFNQIVLCHLEAAKKEAIRQGLAWETAISASRENACPHGETMALSVREKLIIE